MVAVLHNFPQTKAKALRMPYLTPALMLRVYLRTICQDLDLFLFLTTGVFTILSPV